MTSSSSARLAHPRAWSQARVPFLSALVLAGIVPFVVAGLISPRLTGLSLFWYSFAASWASIAVGYNWLRSLTAYPGIRAGFYILPAVSSAYAAAAVVLILLRLEYSRPLILASYAICTGWFFFAVFRSRNDEQPSVAVVPFGEVTGLDEIGGISWTWLDSPAQEPGAFSAIVADFHFDLPDEWDTYLADAALRGVTVLHVRQLRESLTGRVEISRLSENSHGTLRPQAAYFAPKFLFDVVASALLLVLLAPLLAVVALLIRLETPGPIIFRQERVGYRGVPFRVWKFRTMTHAAAPQADARLAAITQDGDKRITRLGRVLRRSRIDELPQLVNVVRGQMSLIGPRPEAAVLVDWYEREIPFYRYRHIVRPGITGWAQVNQGHVADVGAVHSKLYYDFYYISNFSLWLDLLIAMRTLRTMLTGFGAK